MTLFNPIRSCFSSVHDLINEESIAERCIELYDWFCHVGAVQRIEIQLSAPSMNLLMNSQYSKKLMEAKEEWRCDGALRRRGFFDCICKIVSWEATLQDFVDLRKGWFCVGAELCVLR